MSACCLGSGFVLDGILPLAAAEAQIVEQTAHGVVKHGAHDCGGKAKAQQTDAQNCAQCADTPVAANGDVHGILGIACTAERAGKNPSAATATLGD